MLFFGAFHEAVFLLIVFVSLWLYQTHRVSSKTITQHSIEYLIKLLALVVALLVGNGIYIGLVLALTGNDLMFMTNGLLMTGTMLVALASWIVSVVTVIALWGFFEHTRRNAVYCLHVALLTVPVVGLGWFFWMFYRWRTEVRRINDANSNVLSKHAEHIVWLTLGSMLLVALNAAGLYYFNFSSVLAIAIGSCQTIASLVLVYFWIRFYHALYYAKQTDYGVDDSIVRT